MLGRCSVVATSAVCVLLGCSRPPNHAEPSASATIRTTTPARVPLDSSGSADDGQWTMPARNYASTRYSGLGQITRENVGQLKLAWSFSTGVNRGHEAAPLVVGSTMYVVAPFPNYLYALDLKKPGTLKWKYDPKAEAASKGEACCDW